MNSLYQMLSISKQAVHKQGVRRQQKTRDVLGFYEKADQIRREHPGVGCRKMAWVMRKEGWGRDKIEQELLDWGYRLAIRRKYTRTTYAQSSLYAPDLIEGMEFNGINQVIQTDITYMFVNGKYYYVVFLIDIYSRRIVGYAVSISLEATANIRAMAMCLKLREKGNVNGMIHHSDRGSQFIDINYRQMLSDNGVIMSMCKEPWKNAYIERVNQTIKSEYLDHWQIDTYKQLQGRVKQAVHHYNYERKHDSLGRKSPVDFEKELDKMPTERRPVLKVFKSDTSI